MSMRATTSNRFVPFVSVSPADPMTKRRDFTASSRSDGATPVYKRRKRSASHSRHHDHVPRARHVAVRDVDEGGGVQRKGLVQGGLQLFGVGGLEGGDAEAVGQAHEVGIVQVRGD